MGIVKSVQHSGSTRTSTLNGNIELNEGTGQLIIRNGVHIITQVDSEGFTYSQPDGTRRIRIGLNPKDNTIGEYISKPNVDVIGALENGS